MATHAGYGGAVKVGSVAVAEVKDFSLETTANTADTTVLGGSGWTDVDVTTTSWTASLNCIWDDDDAGQQDLVEGLTVTLNLYPRGDSSGKELWSGSALVTSVSKTVSAEGLIEAAISVTGKGAMAETDIQ